MSTILRGFKISVVLFNISLVLLVVSVIWFGHIAGAVAPMVTIGTSDGGSSVDARADIVFSSDGMLFKDSEGSSFITTDDVSQVFSVTRQSDDSAVAGTWMVDSVTIGSESDSDTVTVVTFMPDADFSEGDGAIIASVTDAYYNEDGEQGTAVRESFSVDVAVPYPLSAAYDGVRVAVTMSEPVYGSVLVDSFVVMVGDSEVVPVNVSGLSSAADNSLDMFVLNFSADDADFARDTVITLSYSPSLDSIGIVDRATNVSDGFIDLSVSDEREDEVDEGSGDDGTTGDDGAGDDGTGSDASGDDVNGDDGTGDDGTGDDGTTGGDDGTGDDGTGSDASGDDVNGDDGTGDDGTTGDDGAGDDGTGSDASGDDVNGDDGTTGDDGGATGGATGGDDGTTDGSEDDEETPAPSEVVPPIEIAINPIADGFVNSRTAESGVAISGTTSGTDTSDVVSLLLVSGSGEAMVGNIAIDSEIGVWSVVVEDLGGLAEGVVSVYASVGVGDDEVRSESVTFVYDITAPVLTEAVPIAVVTEDTTPEYGFSSSEAGSLTYAGSCVSETELAVRGSNTVIFNELVRGEYGDCTISVTDEAGNISESLAVRPFTVAVGPTAEFSVSEGAYSNDAEMNFVVTFSEDVYRDAEGVAVPIDAVNAADIITLWRADSAGEVLSFSAVVDGSVVTVDPVEMLEDGLVYLAVSDEYYNADGEQGNSAGVSVVVDATEPTITSVALDGLTAVVTMSEEVFGAVSTNAFLFTVTQEHVVSSFTPDVVSLLASAPEDADTSFTLTISSDEVIDSSAGVSLSYVPAETGSVIIDKAGNVLAAVEDFVLVEENDENPPVLSDPGSIGSTNSATPDFTFVSSEAGTISYTGSCSSAMTVAVRGENSVTFDALTDGAYNDCVLTVTDAAENVSLPLSVPLFTVDITLPDAPTLSPSAGETVQEDAAIVVSFAEVVYRSDGVTELTTGDFSGVESIITIEKIGGENVGDTFVTGYTVVKDGLVFTLTPAGGLEQGVHYRIVVSDEYYDGSGNQGSATESGFNVAEVETPEDDDDEGDDDDTDDNDTDDDDTDTDDISGVLVSRDAVVTFSPENGGVIDNTATDLAISFDKAVFKNSNGEVFTSSDLARFVSLRTRDETGYGLSFVATMNDENTMITVDPVDNLPPGRIYVGISADYYTADGTRGQSQDAIFTVDVKEFFISFFTNIFLDLFSSGSFNMPTITETYTFGMFDVNIKLAQVLLDKSECPVSSTDPLSPSVTEGYLDSLTEEALMCYQLNNGFEVTGHLTPETFDSLVAMHYQGELEIPGFDVLLIVDDLMFNENVLQQAFYLLQKAFLTIGVDDLSPSDGESGGNSGNDTTTS